MRVFDSLNQALGWVQAVLSRVQAFTTFSPTVTISAVTAAVFFPYSGTDFRIKR